jgi:hypothetical protein
MTEKKARRNNCWQKEKKAPEMRQTPSTVSERRTPSGH